MPIKLIKKNIDRSPIKQVYTKRRKKQVNKFIQAARERNKES